MIKILKRRLLLFKYMGHFYFSLFPWKQLNLVSRWGGCRFFQSRAHEILFYKTYARFINHVLEWCLYWEIFRNMSSSVDACYAQLSSCVNDKDLPSSSAINFDHCWWWWKDTYLKMSPNMVILFVDIFYLSRITP